MRSYISRQLLRSALFTLIVIPLATGFLFLFPGEPDMKAVFFLAGSFFILLLISIVILHFGQNKPGDIQPLFAMAAIGLKFLLSAILALVYILVLKKTELEYIILFFILYLAFTVYLVWVMLKTLKVKSIKQDQY